MVHGFMELFLVFKAFRYSIPRILLGEAKREAQSKEEEESFLRAKYCFKA